MYIDKIALKSSPMFRLKGDDYHAILDKLKDEKEHEEDVEAVVSLIVRTDRTNEVLIDKESLLFVNEIYGKAEKTTNYMNLLQTCKVILDDIVTKDFKMEHIRNTVVMPVGVFLEDNKMHFYFNLIIKEELKDLFKYQFVNLEDLSLNDIDDKSIIVLPTLVKTN